MRHHCLTLLLILLAAAGCHAQPRSGTAGTPLRVGAERLLDAGCDSLRDRTVAVVANHSSLAGGTHLVDTLRSRGVRVAKIFCPEHGFRGTAAAGAAVKSGTDPATGLPVVSLYGKNKKPTAAQLRDVEAVLFDLQDVGCRFYTYLSTLHYVMEACAENDKPLILLDRPNPNGHYVDGPILDTARFRSFVGMHPVPVVYGMTIGEYALMINGEGWLKGGRKCRLTVVPMEGYRRDSVGYELPVPPSPNLRNAHAVALYPSLCLFEGTRLSVGRGTDHPFEVVGTPHCRNWKHDTCFGPQRMPAIAFTPQGGRRCYGIDLRGAATPARLDLSWLIAMHGLTAEGLFFLDSRFFENLAGTADLRRQIQEGVPEETIRDSWRPGLELFLAIRSKYLIYQ